MKITKDQIMGALPNLSKVDLTAINALTGVLLKQGLPDPTKVPNDPQGWLFEALQGVSGQGYRLPHGVKSFNQNAPAFVAFVKANFPKAKTKVAALGVMRMLLKLIADDLIARSAPATINTLAINMPRVAEVFDAAFPGYRESGLVRLVMPTAGQLSQRRPTLE